MVADMIWASLQGAVADTAATSLGQRLYDFLDTPAPYSPFSEYLAILFLLWLLARRGNRKHTFERQAQEVLEEKYQAGEISKKAYDKYRQDVTLRPKR